MKDADLKDHSQKRNVLIPLGIAAVVMLGTFAYYLNHHALDPVQVLLPFKPSSSDSSMPEQDAVLPPVSKNGFANANRSSASVLQKTTRKSEDEEALGELVGIINTGNFPDAVIVADKILSNLALSQSVRERAMAWKGRLLVATGQTNEAIAILQSLMSTAADEQARHEAVAKYFLLKSRDAIAVEIQRRESDLQNKSPNPVMMSTLAEFYGYTCATNKELAIREELAVLTNDIGNCKRLLKFYRASGDYEKMTNILTRLANMGPPHSVKYLVQRAGIELELTDRQAAISTCEQILAMNELEFDVLFSVGVILVRAAEYNKAQSVMETCILGAKSSRENQLCLLELCRIAVKTKKATAATAFALRDLAQKSIVSSVKRDAVSLLEQMNKEGL